MICISGWNVQYTVYDKLSMIPDKHWTKKVMLIGYIRRKKKLFLVFNEMVFMYMGNYWEVVKIFF